LKALRNFDEIEAPQISRSVEIDEDRREALTNLAAQLLELREMLKTKKPETVNPRHRSY
jgi:hypothetical protein